MKTAIVWFRRDLRLSDNPALRRAVDTAERVLPVYIWAPDEEAPWQPGAASRWWLHHSLQALGDALRHAGAPLLLRRGDSLSVLRALIRETGAEGLYWNRLYEPAAIRRDAHIKRVLGDDGIELGSFNAALLHEPWTVRSGSGDPYRVFTPFWRSCQRLPGARPEPAVRKITGLATPPTGDDLASLHLLPTIEWTGGLEKTWAPGERGAQAALRAFGKEAMFGYTDARDQPALTGTSRLSPYLHFGEIGPRQVVAAMEQAAQQTTRSGAITASEQFTRQLGWREFAHHLLFHYPQTPERPLNARFEQFPWRHGKHAALDLTAWQGGNTGIPIVDAGMRELWAHGWMHNRVRMIVASFLTKNLLLPWQDGARWFWDTLVDADLANNTLGWQWVAGCGADAAPYFRIFNPVRQAEKFDANADYVRRWVPELAPLPAKAALAPFDAKPDQFAGFERGRDYAPPLADLGASRQRALDAYASIKR